MCNSNFVPVGGVFSYAGVEFTVIENSSCDFCAFHSSGRCLRPIIENIDLRCCNDRPDGKEVTYVSSDLVEAIRRSLT